MLKRNGKEIGIAVAVGKNRNLKGRVQCFVAKRSSGGEEAWQVIERSWQGNAGKGKDKAWQYLQNRWAHRQLKKKKKRIMNWRKNHLVRTDRGRCDGGVYFVQPPSYRRGLRRVGQLQRG